MSELTVGFVGLGNMGWPMAANLHAAGLALIVRDADADRQAAVLRRVTRAPSPPTTPGAFAAADIVVTMLPDGAVVADALLSWGIGAVLQPGTLVVEMSSSDPSDTLRTAADLAAHGVRVVDAPVSGGVPRAVTGELSLMVGGDDADVARGPAGAARARRPGQAVPHRRARHRARDEGAEQRGRRRDLLRHRRGDGRRPRFGLDPKTMVDIINASTGRSFVSELCSARTC